MTCREAGQVLNLTARQVQRLAAEGGPLEATRREPIILVTLESVEALAAKRMVAPEHE